MVALSGVAPNFALIYASRWLLGLGRAGRSAEWDSFGHLPMVSP